MQLDLQCKFKQRKYHIDSEGEIQMIYAKNRVN